MMHIRSFQRGKLACKASVITVIFIAVLLIFTRSPFNDFGSSNQEEGTTSEALLTGERSESIHNGSIMAAVLGRSHGTGTLSSVSSRAGNRTTGCVVLDAGHGGKDGGADREEVNEKDIALDIALKTGARLEEKGVQVIYTRTGDVFVPLENRAQIANEAKADLFVSIHLNATDDGPIWSGSETLYSAHSSRDGKMTGKKLAQLLQQAMVEKLDTQDNGIRYSPQMKVLRLTEMPGVIAEAAYISHKTERMRMETDEFRMKTAEALTEGILNALELMK